MPFRPFLVLKKGMNKKDTLHFWEGYDCNTNSDYNSCYI